MTLNPVYLLPCIALAMIIFLPILDSDSTLSKSLRSRRRRKILLGRLTVLVLLLATLATVIWPIPNWNGLVQGVLLSLVVLLPALVFNAYLSHRYGNQRQEVSLDSDAKIVVAEESLTQMHPSEAADSVSVTDRGMKPERKESLQESVRRESPLGRQHRRPAIDLTKESQGKGLRAAMIEATQSADRALENSGKSPDFAVNSIPSRSNSMEPDPIDSPAEIHEQLGRVADLVRSHDIGVGELSGLEDDESWHGLRERHDRQSALSTQVINSDVPLTDLANLSTNEITRIVDRLQQDKTRLQKLVIAQQAAIESERQAHDQSRLVAKDAIKIMRDARNAQKFAEKLARRERSERQRVEQQYKRVAQALNNAMSIIESRRKTAE